MQVNGRPMDLREDLQEVYVRMGDDKRDQLRRMLEKMQGNLQRSPKIDAHAGWWPQAPQCSWPGSWVCPCSHS